MVMCPLASGLADRFCGFLLICLHAIHTAWISSNWFLVLHLEHFAVYLREYNVPAIDEFHDQLLFWTLVVIISRQLGL